MNQEKLCDSTQRDGCDRELSTKSVHQRTSSIGMPDLRTEYYFLFGKDPYQKTYRANQTLSEDSDAILQYVVEQL